MIQIPKAAASISAHLAPPERICKVAGRDPATRHGTERNCTYLQDDMGLIEGDRVRAVVPLTLC